MKSPLLAKIKFEPTFFQVLWRFVFSLSLPTYALLRSGRQGEVGGRGAGGIPPAEPVNEIGSDIFKYVPPVGKRGGWLALCEDSPADFRRKIKFFVFVLQSKKARSGLF